MKAVIIGSHRYKEKIEELKKELEKQYYKVKIPAFDYHPDFNELEICTYNKKLIKWADVIYIIWDRRSYGTVFDFGMAFALGKEVIVHYLEPKVMENVMIQYSKESTNRSCKTMDTCKGKDSNKHIKRGKL